MIQPLPPIPPIVWGFIGLTFIFIVLAIYNGIRMFKAPKDTRLDMLITKVDMLIQRSGNLADKDDVNKLTKAIKA